MNLDNAAHWAELISAFSSMCVVIGVGVKIYKTTDAILHSLHSHHETEGYLRAEKIRRVFTPAHPGLTKNEFAP